MKKVEQVINDIIRREGGDADHPSDRGGPTRWGITEAVARENDYYGDMRDLPREKAYDILLNKYYIKPGFDVVEEHSALIAEELADTGVNMGSRTAITFLQRALNAFNKGGDLYDDLIVDGFIGSNTILALSSYLQYRDTDGEQVLLKSLNCLQGERYIWIAERDEEQEDFTYGWIRHRIVLV